MRLFRLLEPRRRGVRRSWGLRRHRLSFSGPRRNLGEREINDFEVRRRTTMRPTSKAAQKGCHRGRPREVCHQKEVPATGNGERALLLWQLNGRPFHPLALPITASPSVSSPPRSTVQRSSPSLRCSLPFLCPSMGVQSAPAISHGGCASCVRSDRARAAVKCKSRSDSRTPFRASGDI